MHSDARRHAVAGTRPCRYPVIRKNSIRAEIRWDRYLCMANSTILRKLAIRHAQARAYLTQQEFVELYDMCNEVLHVWNPFSPEVPQINFVRTVDDWVGRIQRLLDIYRTQIARSEEIWIIQMVHPEDGKAHAFRASPREP
jgi:hypothetical protein